MITIATLAVVAVGVFIAYWFIGRRPVPVAAPMPVPAIVALARADVGGNAINETLFARPGHLADPRARSTPTPRASTARSTAWPPALGGLSGRWRHWQNGFVRSYALSMFAGHPGRRPACCCW